MLRLIVKISKRLALIAKWVPEGSKLADIGSDHALLPTFLAQTARISGAIAGEINSGPYAAAQKQVIQAQLQHCIEVRKGDGLAVLVPNEVDCITIAGMGGAMIASILDQGKEKLVGVTRLILQPNVGESLVRKWLVENSWELVAEEILEEDQKIYEILVADKTARADQENASLFQGKGRMYKFGPYLMQNPSAVFALKWCREMNKLAQVQQQLARSTSESSKEKWTEVQHEIECIKEVLDCLPTDKP